jgi:hypothetical protein
MKIRIVSTLKSLATPLAKLLRENGHRVEVRRAKAEQCALHYAEGSPLAALTGLVDCLKPLLPSVSLVPSIEGADAELYLGDEKEFEEWDVKLHADSGDFGRSLQKKILAFGFDDDGLEIAAQSADTLEYGGATVFSRQVIRWILAQEGIHNVNEKKRWGDGDNDMYIYAREPIPEGQDVRARLPIVIEGDDYGQMFALKARLTEKGFGAVETRSIDDRARLEFGFAPGGFVRDAETLAELRGIIQESLDAAQVSTERHPLKTVTHEGRGALIRLPLGAHAAGRLPSYAGRFPDRWDIVIRTDALTAVAEIRGKLIEHGYTRVRFEALPSSALGFRVQVGAAVEMPEVGDFVKGAVERTLKGMGAPKDLVIMVSPSLPSDDPRVVIELPMEGLDEGGLKRRIRAACSDWEFSFKSPDSSKFADLVREFRDLNFKEFATDEEADVGEALIKYGGAPVALVEYVAGMVQKATGHHPRLKKEWDDDDDDIWVYVPVAHAEVVEEPEAPDLAEWFADLEAPEARPFIEVTDKTVRVGHVTLPRREASEGDAELVPPADGFEHYCLDTRTADTLLHVAESAALREPCLLEGETSVSKTSIIQYLAMLLNQPVVRLNLNGQTDTGELVGRFVPRAGGDEGHPWRWQDGLVIEAMKRGWWVVLDELNLAEPQILERLNSVLERIPSIIMTEYDNSLIGPGGVAVHPRFRMFGTMNPAEYAGRSPLSPAYRDRWRGYKFVPAPGEVEYRAMLQYLVTGRQPDVTLMGTPYLGHPGVGPLAALNALPGIQKFLAALARFHAALEGAVGRTSGEAIRLGGRRRDRYIFTRRGLLAVMDYLAAAMTGDDPLRNMRSALVRYYVGKVSSGRDQAVVLRLLDAAGIGPNTWTLTDKGDKE